MGKLLSKIFGNKEMRILMLGLDAAGKTSILYHRYMIHYSYLNNLSSYSTFISLWFTFFNL